MTPIIFCIQSFFRASQDKSVARAKLHHSIMNSFNEIPNSIKLSTAGRVFSDSLDEFLKNAIDSNAKTLSISFDQHDDFSEIKIIDDGDGIKFDETRTPEFFASYDWQMALTLDSQKGKSALGGKNLGLALAAHLLDVHGKGLLKLEKNENKGSTLTLLSTKEKCVIDDCFPENVNCVHEMIFDMIKNPKIDPVLIEFIKAKNNYPENYQKRVVPRMKMPDEKVVLFIPKKREKKATSALFSANEFNDDKLILDFECEKSIARSPDDLSIGEYSPEIRSAVSFFENRSSFYCDMGLTQFTPTKKEFSLEILCPTPKK